MAVWCIKGAFWIGIAGVFNLIVHCQGGQGPRSAPCHCRNFDVCPLHDAKCPDGVCAQGWTNSPHCDTPCPQGSFGDGCSKTCKCIPGDVCNHVNGVCPGQCQHGWGGGSCQVELPRLLAAPAVIDIEKHSAVVTWPPWTEGHDPGHLEPISYILECSTTGNSWSAVETLPAGDSNDCRANLSGLNAWTRYVVRVTLQYDDDGKHVTSLPGDVTHFTTKCDVPSAAPPGIKLAAAVLADLIQLTATWQALPDAQARCDKIVSYDVSFCCTNDACSDKKIRVTGCQASIFIPLPLIPSRAYVTVAAVNNEHLIGEKSIRIGVDLVCATPRPPVHHAPSHTTKMMASHTEPATATTTPSPPCDASPGNLNVTEEGEEFIVISWIAPNCSQTPEYYKIDVIHLESNVVEPSKKWRQYAARGTRAVIPSIKQSTHYRVCVTPMFGKRKGQPSSIKVWTEPKDPPAPEFPEILNTTDETIAMTLGGFSPPEVVSVMRIVVGQQLLQNEILDNSSSSLSQNLTNFLQSIFNTRGANQSRVKRSEETNTVSARTDPAANETSAKTNSSAETQTENKTVNDPDAQTEGVGNAVNMLDSLPSNSTTNGSQANKILDGNTIEILPKKIVTQNDLPFNPDDLQAYNKSETQDYYIAAELTQEEFDKGKVFVLGDGKTYRSYYNAPLKNGYNYSVWFGVTTISGSRIKREYTQVVPRPRQGREAIPPVSENESYIGHWTVMFLCVAGIFALCALLTLVAYLCVNRGRFYPKYGDFMSMHWRETPSRDVSLLETGDREGDDPKPDKCPVGVSYLQAEGNSKSLTIKEFVARYGLSCEEHNDTFRYDHSCLPRGIQAPCDTASLHCNILKNRNPNVVPYDKNRAILVPSNEMQSNYINASVIELTENRTYIVTQAPMASCINDVWRLVWDYDVDNIVVLVDLAERDQPEVQRYWPLHGHAHTYGEITVQALNTEVFADMTVRLFNVERCGSSEFRLIRQLQYHYWTTGGIPVHPIPFLLFMRKIDMYTRSNGTLLVHCHHGGGRSGMYVAIDHLLSKGRNTGRVNVFNGVRRIRLQRRQLVRTFAQYKFIYACLAEAFSRFGTLIRNDEFRSHYERVTHDGVGRHSHVLSAEFHDVKKCDTSLTLSSHTVPAVMFRTPDRRLPVTTHALQRASISLRNHGKNYDAILDAYYLDSYLQRGAFVLAQTPVALQLAQFWDIVYNSKALCIISCDYSVDGSVFWPDKNKNAGPFKLYRFREQEFKAGGYLRRDIKLKTGENDKSARYVRQYQITNWPGCAPAPTAANLLDMFQDVGAYLQSTETNTPMLIHCNDAVSRSGLVAMSWILLQKAEIEKEVDVYRTAKYLVHNAPGALPNIEQYKFCYRFVRKFISRGQSCHQSPATETKPRSRSPRKSGSPRITPHPPRSKSETPKRRIANLFSNSSLDTSTTDGMSKESKDSLNSRMRRSRSLETDILGQQSSSDALLTTDSSYAYLELHDSPKISSVVMRRSSGWSNTASLEAKSSPRSKKSSEHRKKKLRPLESPSPCPCSAPAVPSSVGREEIYMAAESTRPPPLPDLPPPDDEEQHSRERYCDKRRKGPPRPKLPPSRSKENNRDQIFIDRTHMPGRAGIESGTNNSEQDEEGPTPQHGLSQPLTPHSKIAKARRAYFGVESPAVKLGETHSEEFQPGKEVKKKLFREEVGADSSSNSVFEGLIEDNGIEYSLDDISAELQNSTVSQRTKPGYLVKSQSAGNSNEKKQATGNIHRQPVYDNILPSTSDVPSEIENSYENEKIAEAWRRYDNQQDVGPNRKTIQQASDDGYELVYDPSEKPMASTEYEALRGTVEPEHPYEKVEVVQAVVSGTRSLNETISSYSGRQTCASSPKNKMYQSSESLASTDDNNANANNTEETQPNEETKKKKNKGLEKAENTNTNCNVNASCFAVGKSKTINPENTSVRGGPIQQGFDLGKASGRANFDTDYPAISSINSSFSNNAKTGMSDEKYRVTKPIDRDAVGVSSKTNTEETKNDLKLAFQTDIEVKISKIVSKRRRSKSNETLDEESVGSCLVRPGSSYESVISARGFKSQKEVQVSAKTPRSSQRVVFAKPLSSPVKFEVASGAAVLEKPKSERKVPPPVAPKPQVNAKSPGPLRKEQPSGLLSKEA